MIQAGTQDDCSGYTALKDSEYRKSVVTSTSIEKNGNLESNVSSYVPFLVGNTSSQIGKR